MFLSVGWTNRSFLWIAHTIQAIMGPELLPPSAGWAPETIASYGDLVATAPLRSSYSSHILPPCVQGVVAKWDWIAKYAIFSKPWPVVRHCDDCAHTFTFIQFQGLYLYCVFVQHPNLPDYLYTKWALCNLATLKYQCKLCRILVMDCHWEVTISVGTTHYEYVTLDQAVLLTTTNFTNIGRCTAVAPASILSLLLSCIIT